ncbi:MAG: hypothetical protein KJ597_06400 [Nanoarchaeota archaeon]|nr:hypothetical protein [Nanoarchaeota archaeon]
MGEQSRFKLFIHAIILLVLLLGLINIIMISKGKPAYIELFGFFVLLLLTLIGFIGYSKSWGERVFFFVFVFYLLNLVLVWYFIGPLYLSLLLLAVIGFLLSFPKRCHCQSESKTAPTISTEEPHSEVFDLPAEVVEEKKTKTTSRSTAKTKFTPGKFVASKASNIYHLPKCEWAKKIKPHRRTWFKNKEAAWEKGYRAHSCVE